MASWNGSIPSSSSCSGGRRWERATVGRRWRTSVCSSWTAKPSRSSSKGSCASTPGLGTRLWLFSYPCNYAISYTAGPRASVTVDGTRAFALGAMGHLHCLDVGTGTVLWKRDLNRDYALQAAQRMPEWGIAAAPLVYERLVIVHLGGADGACVVAFDKKSGEEVWRALQDRGQYSAPILIQQAGRNVVACWTGDSVAGLDPEHGTVLWRHPLRPVNMPIGVATPVVDDGRLFVSSFYDGSLLLTLRQDTPRRRNPCGAAKAPTSRTPTHSIA